MMITINCVLTPLKAVRLAFLSANDPLRFQKDQIYVPADSLFVSEVLLFLLSATGNSQTDIHCECEEAPDIRPTYTCECAAVFRRTQTYCAGW